MKKIRIYLDYHCFPVWIYNDNKKLICNDLPNELVEDKQLDNAFLEIQNIYDSLFVNNSTEFKYVGFTSEAVRENYLKMIKDAVNLMKTKLVDSYAIEEDIEV